MLATIQYEIMSSHSLLKNPRTKYEKRLSLTLKEEYKFRVSENREYLPSPIVEPRGSNSLGHTRSKSCREVLFCTVHSPFRNVFFHGLQFQILVTTRFSTSCTPVWTAVWAWMFALIFRCWPLKIETSWSTDYKILSSVWIEFRKRLGLHMFQNKVSRNIFGPKKDQMGGESNSEY
jgi:hypothetical protein